MKRFIATTLMALTLSTTIFAEGEVIPPPADTQTTQTQTDTKVEADLRAELKKTIEERDTAYRQAIGLFLFSSISTSVAIIAGSAIAYAAVSHHK